MLRPLRRRTAAAPDGRSPHTSSGAQAQADAGHCVAPQGMRRTPAGAAVLTALRAPLRPVNFNLPLPESLSRLRFLRVRRSASILDPSAHFRQPPRRRSSATPSTPPQPGAPPPSAGPFATKSYEQLVRLSQASYVKLLFRSRFLGGVCKRVFDHDRNKDTEPFRAQVQVIQDELINQNKRFSFMKPDAKDHLYVASLVLATYRVLAPKLKEDAKAVEVVQGAFMEQLDIFYNVIVPMYLTKKDDDLVQLEGALKTHTRVMGESFDVTFARTPAGFSATVRKCFFNDFMEANRASFLMGPVFCTADNMWKAVLPPSKHVQYRRPSTLASGGKSCHFMFKCKETVEEKTKDKDESENEQYRLGFS